jgi:hypothetical protein
MRMNEPTKYLVPLLTISAPHVPFLIIFLVGAVLSVMRWRSDPMRSRLAFIAFALFIVRLFGIVAMNWLAFRKDDFGWDTRTLGLYLGIITSVGMLVTIVAWILLLVALFSRLNVYVKADPAPESPDRNS